MYDLKIIIDEDDLVEGSIEHKVLKLALSGGRSFLTLGNTYVITKLKSKTYRKTHFLGGTSKKHIIEAMKIKVAESVNT